LGFFLIAKVIIGRHIPKSHTLSSVHFTVLTRGNNKKISYLNILFEFDQKLLFLFEISKVLITISGYGHIAPKTPFAKVATIFYAILGIPLTVLCWSNIGDAMANAFRQVIQCSLTWLFQDDWILWERCHWKNIQEQLSLPITLVMGPGQNILTQIGLGQFLAARVGSDQPLMVWVWIRKISPKNIKFFNFFPFGKKNLFRVGFGSKSTWVKGGSVSHLLWVKSMLGSGQGPSLQHTFFFDFYILYYFL